MAAKKKTSKANSPRYLKRRPSYFELDAEEKPYIPYILLILGVFTFFSLISFHDGPEIKNLFGKLGHYYAYGLFYILGRGAYQIGLLIIIYGTLFFQKRSFDLVQILISSVLVILSTSIYFNIFEDNLIDIRDGGGRFGSFISEFSRNNIGAPGRFIFNTCFFLYGYLVILKHVPGNMVHEFMTKAPEKIWGFRMKIQNKISSFSTRKEGGTLDPFTEEMETRYNHVSPDDREENPSFLDRIKRATVHSSHNVPWVEVRKVQPKEQSAGRPVYESGYSEVYTETNPEYRVSTVYETFELKSKNDDSAYELEEEDYITSDSEKQVYFQETRGELVQKLNTAYKPETGVDSEDGNKTSTIASTFVFPAKEAENGNTGETEEGLKLEADSEKSKPEVKKEKEFINDSPSLVPDFNLKKDYFISQKIFKSNPEKKKKGIDKQEDELNTARKIEQIIREYGYETRVVDFQKGPIITRYEITIPQGVKLSRITSLADELKLYLAVKSIRIVAPIPGKSTIGIEVPNKKRDDVFLGDIIKETQLLQDSSDLKIILGKGISGNNVSIELNRLPHLLIAGTTGSGKSVAMNSMISSLIFSKSPEELRFIMIDPKMVELALYEDIPHLLMPVITDPRKASKALAWAVQEMEARYNCVSDLKCRDLKSYNYKVENRMYTRSGIRHRKMPYIVICIDELSDLMMVSGKELEDYITRISQKSRAVGIHLVMATQRPSVDVITGLIKANCPARIAFHVAQKTDSKIILDYNGADALLGKGDFLYKSPTSSELQRIQAPYITEEEIEKIVNESQKFGAPEYVSINLEDDPIAEVFSDEDQSLFEEAWEIVRTENKASASYLQRRMRIGYNKAARLMEMMEEKGYVGPQIGSKPREILRSSL